MMPNRLRAASPLAANASNGDGTVSGRVSSMSVNARVPALAAHGARCRVAAWKFSHALYASRDPKLFASRLGERQGFRLQQLSLARKLAQQSRRWQCVPR
jgi:hypothetical protein